MTPSAGEEYVYGSGDCLTSGTAGSGQVGQAAGAGNCNTV